MCSLLCIWSFDQYIYNKLICIDIIWLMPPLFRKNMKYCAIIYKTVLGEINVYKQRPIAYIVIIQYII